MITLAYGRTKRKKRKEKRTSEYLLVFAYGDGGDKSCQPAGDFHGQHESRRNRERRPTFCDPPDLRLGIYRFQKLRADERQKRVCVRRDGGHRAFYLAHSLQRSELHFHAGLHRRKHLYHMGVDVCGVVPCNRFHLPASDVSELPQQKKTNEILLRDGDCVDCQLRVPYRVQLQHDGYDILGAAETYGDSGRLRR